MTWDIALILAIDGLANGAVYLLAGLGLVLIFSVTRVVFVPFGDVAAFAALSLAAFETGRMPPFAILAPRGTRNLGLFGIYRNNFDLRPHYKQVELAARGFPAPGFQHDSGFQ